MRLLIFHGYLLHGTGSNVYNAELGAALSRAGHEVDLLCQDRDPFDLVWVDAVGDWDGGALRVSERRSPARATVYRPDIGGLLPVYVADRYEGVEARPYPDLSEAEVERYIERNVAAVRDVVRRTRPDVALANHLVMGPVILARALAGLDVPYAVKIHGSALEYTVKPHPERFLAYAREGLAGARGVLVGSRHTAESLWAALDDPDLPGRTFLGPPGVDVVRFSPREPSAAIAGLDDLRRRLDAKEPVSNVGSSFDRDLSAAARALDRIEPGDRLVVFVGKLIGSKGVELLLAAWPLVLARVPDARLVVVGFGAFRDGLEQLVVDLEPGDLDAVRATRSETGAELPWLSAFADSLSPGDAATAGLRDRIVWTGRLDHGELADLLPAADAMVVPSTFPEAFGMVAAEAAACGALPVVARHSGLAEVAEALAAQVPEPARSWLSFEVGPRAVHDLAEAVAGWLEAPADVRAATRAAIVGVTRERWSWEGVARSVIDVAQGGAAATPIDRIPPP
jgi:glycosyltransferase involved in cell wall biosynthesis